MSYYQFFKKNFWERKVFNKENDFDLRLLRDQDVSEEDANRIGLYITKFVKGLIF